MILQVSFSSLTHMNVSNFMCASSYKEKLPILMMWSDSDPAKSIFQLSLEQKRTDLKQYFLPFVKNNKYMKQLIKFT